MKLKKQKPSMGNDVLTNVNLYWPEARNWMWDYCIYLGPYTDDRGANFDLGVYFDINGEMSGAIVDGNEPGSYTSPDLSGRFEITRPAYIETVRRAKELNLIK